MWTAKNFQEFINIIVMLKDAWKLPMLVHDFSGDKDAFMGELEQVEFEYNEKPYEVRIAIDEEIEALRNEFHTVAISDLYTHITESFLDKNNHADVRFSDSDIKEISLGHYAYGD
jgi:hypothetical protein